MSINYQILEWDTSFFCTLVARIIPERLTISELDNILLSLKNSGVSLVYWASDPTDEESQKASKKLGGFLADRKTTYVVNSSDFLVNQSPPKLNLVIEEYINPIPNVVLENLAIQSGTFSRFNRDPKITSKQFEDLYKIWISQSANKSIADAVFIAKHNEEIVGMITIKKEKETGIIGLLAVDIHMRGKSIATNLVKKAHKWFIANNCKTGKVITQKDNVAACKLYESCGYQIQEVKNLYHFWI